MFAMQRVRTNEGWAALLMAAAVALASSGCGGTPVVEDAGPPVDPLGLHDYPQLLADWSKNQGEGLMMRGADVSGALRPPSAADLENVDVIVMYKGDAELTMTPQQKADLVNFLKSLTDTSVATNPKYSDPFNYGY